MNHDDILNNVYEEALLRVSKNELTVSGINDDDVGYLDLIVERSESNKGMVAVLTTLLTHKICNPEQDIRYHQAQLENGFAGRGVDQNHVTPFMKKVNFPSMAESGWLTRSLEQPHPYDLSYPGKIRPESVKTAFLQVVNSVEVQHQSPKDYLLYFFIKLIKQRDDMNIDLAKPHSLSIANIVDILEKHFTYSYSCAGASRLPAIAIYAAYQCMMSQVSRYKDKVLCELESHNSSDAQSGQIGDVQVNNSNGSAYEGVEVKHQIKITKQLVADAYEKFKVYNTDRYYLLTTANMEKADWDGINSEIQRIRNIHGCQVIVNGVYSSLKYYLRLVEDPAEFIDYYVEAMKHDDTIKFQHKTVWNDIISGEI